MDRSAAAILLAISLVACHTDPIVTDPDDDADGFSASEDCDDAASAVSPVAPEICDGIDNDCDGHVDEGVLESVWLDADGDGYGTPTWLCDPPESAMPGDCDDQDPAIFPGAAETWYDGLDQDCDTADDFDADSDGHAAEPWGDDCDDTRPATHAGADEIWYDGLDQDCAGGDDFDADGDGYEALAFGGFDCDDQDPTVNPIAVEVWYDGVDQDCDSNSDFDADSDGFDRGRSDCDDADATVHPSAAEHCDGFDDDCDGWVDNSCEVGSDTSITRWYGEHSGQGGASFSAFVPDVDGDGRDDVVLGIPSENSMAPASGAVRLVSSGSRGDTPIDDSLAVIHSADQTAPIGRAVAVGDASGDGITDYLLGMPTYTDRYDQGAAWLILGPVSGDVILEDDAVAMYVGDERDSAGNSVALPGDMDGDGVADLVIGAPHLWGGTGGVYIVPATVRGQVALADMETHWTGEANYDLAGDKTSAAGDLNGDGWSDLLVAATAWGGEVYVIHGPMQGSQDLSAADAVISGDARSEMLGGSLAGTGDLDGDGYGDIVIGDPFDDRNGADAGAAWILLGPATGTRYVTGAQGAYFGDEADRFGGMSVSAAGDVDEDGFADVLIGGYDPWDVEPGGWLVRGPATGRTLLSMADRRFESQSRLSCMGGLVSGGGDADGDGIPDILISAMCDGSYVYAGGSIFLFSGASLF